MLILIFFVSFFASSFFLLLLLLLFVVYFFFFFISSSLFLLLYFFFFFFFFFISSSSLFLLPFYFLLYFFFFIILLLFSSLLSGFHDVPVFRWSWSRPSGWATTSRPASYSTSESVASCPSLLTRAPVARYKEIPELTAKLRAIDEKLKHQAEQETSLISDAVRASDIAQVVHRSAPLPIDRFDCSLISFLFLFFKVVSRATGIPVHTMMQSEREKLLHMEGDGRQPLFLFSSLLSCCLSILASLFYICCGMDGR
jgi:hypothetical protein